MENVQNEDKDMAVKQKPKTAMDHAKEPKNITITGLATLIVIGLVNGNITLPLKSSGDATAAPLSPTAVTQVEQIVERSPALQQVQKDSAVMKEQIGALKEITNAIGEDVRYIRRAMDKNSREHSDAGGKVLANK